MRNYFERLLQSFDFDSASSFYASLAPSSKYAYLGSATVAVSSVSVVIERVFGLDSLAFILLLFGFLVEVGSGLIASIVSKVPIESFKATRFTVKTVCYMLLIALPYVLSVSFEARGKTAITVVFDWLYLFFLCQIVWELTISILENVAVISGKDKTHWIKKLQDKIGGLLQ
ncbi:phage holin family protein [Pedobacter arcticus]|uniref:phage holin family protein n=1 Tax=Pedobacter arcticus TaxID=752140 RepID=UPI0002EAE8A8|nr:phage holin family protein [Pedobacter arcticus]